MFKAICDITITGKTIEYDNCKVCYVGGLKATSSGEDPLRAEALQFASVWSNQGLNPKNPTYSKAYSAILKKAAAVGSDSLKYVGLFEIDPGLGYQMPISEKLQFVQLYETIIATDEPHDTDKSSDDAFLTGYQPYHIKLNQIKITNSTGNTFLTFGVLTNLGGLGLDLSANEYLLKYKGTLSCTEIQDAKEDDEATQFHYNGKIYTKYSSDSFNDYMKFVEQSVIKQLHKRLATYRKCELDKDSDILFVDATKVGSLDETRAHCEAQGGTMKSMRAVLNKFCPKGSDKLISWSSAFSLTCANYKDFLTFDEKGEIVDSHIDAVVLGSETHSLHNEL